MSIKFWNKEVTYTWRYTSGHLIPNSVMGIDPAPEVGIKCPLV